MSNKVTQLQKELENALKEAKKGNRGFKLRDVITPGQNVYRGQGAFRAQSIRRIKDLLKSKEVTK